MMCHNLPDISRDPRLAAAVKLAVDEDLGAGDVTSAALVAPDAVAEGAIIAREACRVAGNAVAAAVFKAISAKIEVSSVLPDGASASANAEILRVRGPAGAILAAERTALNFMQRMCGVATLTASFTQLVAEFGTLILDTRKTTPGLRFLEKYSVLCGGGTNHRFGLYDRVLMKDNHRRLWAGGDPKRLDLAVIEARKKVPGIVVEIEVETLEELRSAISARPEWVMLDNMPCALMRRAVEINAGVSKLEASGGITLKNVREVAATGVDAISLGCLTHSAPSIDLSLEWINLDLSCQTKM